MKKNKLIDFRKHYTFNVHLDVLKQLFYSAICLTGIFASIVLGVALQEYYISAVIISSIVISLIFSFVFFRYQTSTIKDEIGWNNQRFKDINEAHAFADLWYSNNLKPNQHIFFLSMDLSVMARRYVTTRYERKRYLQQSFANVLSRLEYNGIDLVLGFISDNSYLDKAIVVSSKDANTIKLTFDEFCGKHILPENHIKDAGIATNDILKHIDEIIKQRI